MNKSIEPILGRVSFKSPETVLYVLLKNPGLSEHLSAKMGRLTSLFGPETRYSLDAYPCPECGSLPTEVVLGVQTSLSVTHARELLDRFYEEWWDTHGEHEPLDSLVCVMPEWIS